LFLYSTEQSSLKTLSVACIVLDGNIGSITVSVFEFYTPALQEGKVGLVPLCAVRFQSFRCSDMLNSGCHR